MIYILTNTTTVLQTEVRPQESQIGDPSVKAQLNLTLKQKLTPQSFQDQQRYLNSSAIAAYVSLNKLDQRQRFRAGINLTTQHNDSFNFSQGSSSSGLGYALALFESWWRVVLKKPGKFEFPIFATGEILTSGHVQPISHICEKIDSVCAYVETNQDQFTQFSICYPIQNDDDITKEQRKKIADLGGVLVTVTRLQNLIGELLGDSYDGDPLGRWAPFKGLSSFEYEDSVRFFGRSKDVNRLYDDLKQNQGLLIVSGASGTGKSSLIKAGLIPKLEQENNQFSWAYTTPSKVPENIGIIGFLFEELNKAWQIEKKGLSITELISTFARSPNKAIEKISTIVDDKTPPCLIFFDQFEEVFSQANESIVIILKVLNELANQLKPLYIVLALRNEYLGRLLDNQALSSPVISNVASQLELDDWQAIIHEQSAFSGITFEHDSEGGALDKVIIDEASKTPYALPMVEFLLEQLYLKATLENPNATELKYLHYKELGGLTGAIAYRATQVLKDNQANEKLIAQLFDTFVGLNGDFLPYAKQVDLNKLEADSPQTFKLAQQFIDANLIVSVNNTTVKLVHDSLFNNWNELKQWVTNNKDYLEWRYSVDGQFLRWCSEQKNNYLIKDNRLLKEGWRYYKNGIVSDNRLAKYLKLSKRYKTNVRFSFSFIFIILPLLLSSIYYWDQQRVKSKYFANIVEVQSVPKGIYELTEEEQKHLGKYYRFDFQGGVLKKLSYQNSVGILITNPHKDKAAIWEYKYTADGKLLSVDIKTNAKKRKRVDTYQFNKNQSLVTIGKNHGDGDSYSYLLRDSFKKLETEISGTHKYKYFYNESGFITKKYYLNAFGNRVLHSGLSWFGEEFTYTKAGQVATQLFLDLNGQQIKSTANNSVPTSVKYEHDEKGFNIKEESVFERDSIIKVRKYDNWGNNKEIRQTNKLKELIGNTNKPARTVFKYDSSGNMVEKLTYNPKGSLVEGLGGYSRRVIKYDKNGRASQLNDYVQDFNSPNNTVDGWKKLSTINFLYDKDGNFKEISNAPSLGDNYIRTRFIYDDKGNAIEQRVLDQSGVFLSVSGNHSYVKYKYNDLGNIIEQASFVGEEEVALYDDDYHKLVLSYNDAGINTGRAYFGKKGEPVANKDGIWRYVYDYDDNNRLKSTSHYYPNKNSKMILKNDQSGNQTETIYFDENGKRALGEHGFSKRVYRYDDSNNKIETSYLNEMDQLMMSSEGFAKQVIEYDPSGLFIKRILNYKNTDKLVDYISLIKPKNLPKNQYKKNKVKLKLSSNVLGAKVFINGVFQGTTDYALEVIPGEIELRIELEKYTTYKKTIELYNDQIIDVQLTLRPKLSFDELMIKAKNGQALEQKLLGDYLVALSLKSKKRNGALNWYKMSAKQGFAPAMRLMASWYLGSEISKGDFSKIAKKDLIQGVDWLKGSAKQGSGESQYDLGYLYEHGHIGAKNIDTALNWYEKSAEQGDSRALSRLGRLYFLGNTVKQDRSKGLHMLELAAQLGVKELFTIITSAYNGAWGEEFNDFAKSYYWTKKAVDIGNIEAYSYLGYAYYEGIGVDFDQKTAMKWLMKSVDSKAKNASTSIATMGLIYEKGRNGIKNYEKAFDCFKKGAASGNALSMYKLGVYYSTGYGTPVDKNQASYWFEKAKTNGYK
ncbi:MULTISPECIES: nSTAND1 domain-containing NTPase [Colwellia]|uniref:PEGA domain-containing protein n=1 Tax=Colwellia marinimaniae TaxID=1513592 RepID=A0ABQ0MZS4_9GAMM|nr:MULTISPECIES: PEGA domain-containing protein [Colwellia]GAW97861.1 hypothetical protein MTCD1_03509 [Colwellia marinimaniae]